MTTAVLASMLLALAAVAPADAAPPPTSVTFQGEEFLHRWSMNGQNEYTPKGSEDLAAWSSMMTLNVTEVGPTRLPELASTMRAQYEKAGAQMLKVDSADGPSGKTEYFQGALFTTDEFMEAAFSRVLVVEDRAVIVTYGKRFYGADVTVEAWAWLKQNGQSTENTLRAWTGVPTLATMAALPQATK